MPNLPPHAAAVPPVVPSASPPTLPPLGSPKTKPEKKGGRRGGLAAGAVIPAAAPGADATPEPAVLAAPAEATTAGNAGSEAASRARQDPFRWNQERLEVLAEVILAGANTAAAVEDALKAHPAFAADAHLLKREGILRWVATLQDQFIDAGRPDLAAKLELRKSAGGGWKVDLGRIAAVMETGAAE